MCRCRRANYWFGVSLLFFCGAGCSVVSVYIRFGRISMDKEPERRYRTRKNMRMREWQPRDRNRKKVRIREWQPRSRTRNST